ncbi:hypothetical protein PULV_a3861 [Pseudoalteromonas ulvae UL12]|nr:hypothetical protein [Pseudoalteromonas ulvae UL12]
MQRYFCNKNVINYQIKLKIHIIGKQESMPRRFTSVIFRFKVT